MFTKRMLLTVKASTDDPVAQFNLAYHWEQEKQESIAISWYQKSALQGYAPAQHNLALYLSKRKDSEKNHEEIISWYKKAAEQGHVNAHYNLGAFLIKKMKDKEQAMTWFRKAASLGHEQAKEYLTKQQTLAKETKSVAENRYSITRHKSENKSASSAPSKLREPRWWPAC